VNEGRLPVAEKAASGAEVETMDVSGRALVEGNTYNIQVRVSRLVISKASSCLL
jgi:hypothetical protein